MKSKNFKKANAGITLIALVITIIVLLILAGVTLSLVGGSDGILGQAEKSRRVTRIDALEEEANLIYSDLLMQKYTGEIANISMSDIVSQLTEKGYEIKQVASSGSAVTGISLDQSSISISANGTATIKVTYEGSSDESQYYAVIDGQNYKMTLNDKGIKIAETASEITEETPSTDTLTATSSDESYVTVGSISGNEITVNGGSSVGSATITVSYGSYSETCTVSVVIKPTEGSTADSSTSFSTAYGTIDVIWLSGTSNTVTTTPNAPILTSNGESMTPVTWTYDSSTETWSEDEIASPTWYCYNAVSGRNEDGSTVSNLTSQWANAKTANDSYFVWIPRYAYRITYYSSKTSTEPTGYYDGYGMWNAADGTVKYTLESGIQTVDYNGEKYIVHPAFETDLDLGGWSDDLSGFWFAKFEMSGSGTTLQSCYGKTLARAKNIATFYTSARQATYGYIGTLDVDGNTSFMNSHMVKNSEWGAVAYLSQSQYGRNGKSLTATRTSFTAISETDYLTGTGQSSTGNVYGVYEMSGGMHEYVACFDKLGDSTYLAGSSYGLNMTTTAQDSDGNYISTKYITTYINGTTTDSGIMIYTVGKTGDSTKEIYLGSGSYGWFSHMINFPSSDRPFIFRAGYISNGTPSYLFGAMSYIGRYYDYGTFRTVLSQ